MGFKRPEVQIFSLRPNGQLTQLVECLRHMEEARGSSPLLPTTVDLFEHFREFGRDTDRSIFILLIFWVYLITSQSEGR